MTVRPLTAASLAILLFAASASAQSFPARSGETGILDVPDAEVTGAGGGLLGVELGFDHAPGVPNDLGPLPIYAVGGLSDRLDLGLTMRQSGQPDDARPSRMLFGAAAKLQLTPPREWAPGFALSLVFDRMNARGVLGGRLAVSTATLPLRLTAFVGGEAEAQGFAHAGTTAGLAAAIPLTQGYELAAEALTGPRGSDLGIALRWAFSKTIGLSFGTNYLPDDKGLRISLGVALSPAVKQKPARAPQAVEPDQEEQPEAVAAGPHFTDDRPHFRLRLPVTVSGAASTPRRLQYAPWTPKTVAAAPASMPTPAKTAAATLDDVTEAQLREQEPAADARARRALATGEQLDAREQAALAERQRLEDRERDLAAREQKLDAREQRIAVRAASTPQLRQLESLEQQLAAQERQTLAQERSFAPTIDAAEGRARDAGAREEVERQEADRLAASVSAAPSRAQQLELRKQALAAKNRQLGAYELRLVARGERLDAVEQQLRTMGERLDARARRLDTRSERLDALEKRATESRPVSAAPKAGGATPAAGAAPKDKAVFVMVVKSPTAIMKEGKSASGAPSQASVPQPSTAVEKAVAAATIVTFPTPASQLSELDRETIDDIAKLAAKDGCELLIWARAKDPRLMAEAQRRAAEIRARVMAVGSLDTKQVVTRITTRPGAQGVDVVVSALRQAKATGAVTPASSAPSPAPGARAAADALLSGESGKRQIREAVQAAQPSIEACVGEHLQARRLRRAEGTLKLTVSARGRVEKVAPTGDDLAGEGLEACLGRSTATWQFPTAEAEYVVDVPITVMTGGPAK